MVGHGSIRLPKQWSRHVKAGVLHAISLASVAISCARGRATGQRRLRAQLEQATSQIALLREELSIKDDRWERSHQDLVDSSLNQQSACASYKLPSQLRNPGIRVDVESRDELSRTVSSSPRRRCNACNRHPLRAPRAAAHRRRQGRSSSSWDSPREARRSPRRSRHLPFRRLEGRSAATPVPFAFPAGAAAAPGDPIRDRRAGNGSGCPNGAATFRLVQCR
jgi:hypothetical protein